MLWNGYSKGKEQEMKILGGGWNMHLVDLVTGVCKLCYLPILSSGFSPI